MDYVKTNEQIRAKLITNLSSSPKNIYTIKLYKEDDGRIIANIPKLPGVTVYGVDRSDALRRVQWLALQVLCELVRYGDQCDLDKCMQDELLSISFQIE